jgi:DNA invertase Pin-like site-specific DNA recombinase
MRTRHPQTSIAPVTTGRLIGYARVSTNDQDLRAQTEALEKAGIHPDNVHADKMSGVSRRRPGLEAALKDCVAGDTLVTCRLDRLGRSSLDLLQQIKALRERGVHYRTLHDGIDTSSPMGCGMADLLIAVLGAVAQFERYLIAERTKASMQSAKARGQRFGPTQVFDAKKAREMFKNGATVEEVARSFPGSRGRKHMSRQAVYRYFSPSQIARLQRATPRKR